MFLPENKSWTALKAVACVAGLALIQGCAQEMANQPRVDVMKPSHFSFESVANRTPVPGTIARGQNIETTPVQTGWDGSSLAKTIPVTVDEAFIERGRDRYNIFCQHCHGMAGNGDGMVVQRGFPAPPSYHSDRLRDAPDGQFFVTIRNGIGRMPSLGTRIPVEDRWAIVAYVRALQLSQNIPVDALPEADRQKVK
ncbi:c-type cytochrome [Planctomicrobium piriforme]|uniref:Cytochrome C oxidase, cbb3-type, subunit III n=1 Tax=Planctomicrobium piriforme TaxID=1576369 RepID=A0A1I3JFD6_9PLAN|nr:cytochrome c [Planctomicrobium piriforme]SFI58866.1 Cytochrome C oxidase, cbb3-type, subunit III [Planctomicrobium piriforme]